MADDARISTALPRHPKTVRLKRRLGIPGCWSLLCLILWVADNRPDGNLQGLTDEDIGIAADWPGDAGEFVRALVDVRFLDGQDCGFRIHDWAEHNPWAAGRPGRIEKARVAAVERWKRARVATEPDATSMLSVCGEHERAMPTSPHLTTIKSFPQTEFADDHSPVTEAKNFKPTEAQIEQLYKLYPKHVDKLAAKKAIRKAVGMVSAGDPDHSAMPVDEALDYIAQRITLYARCIQGCDRNYIPYPASWFNAGSFWDDEREWSRKQDGKGNGAAKLPAGYVPASERIRQERGTQAGGAR